VPENECSAFMSARIVKRIRRQQQKCIITLYIR